MVFVFFFVIGDCKKFFQSWQLFQKAWVFWASVIVVAVVTVNVWLECSTLEAAVAVAVVVVVVQAEMSAARFVWSLLSNKGN